MSNSSDNKPDLSDLYNQALRYVDNRDYEGAIAILEKAGNPPLNGECLALLGLAYYQFQKYDEAVQRYTDALLLNATNQDWQEMLKRAKANSTAEVNVFVP